MKKRRNGFQQTLHWRKQQNLRIRKLFWLSEGILYLWFMLADLTDSVWLIPSDWLKYFAMVLNMAMALYLFAKEQGSGFLLGAQLLILPADFILLFFDEYAWAGILFFMFVQICYYLQLRAVFAQYTRRNHYQADLGLACLAVLLWVTLWLLMKSAGFFVNGVVLLAALYIVMFSVNVVLSVIEAVRFQQDSGILMAAGLILFFLCDIHVGLVFLVPDFAPGSAAYWYGTHVAGLAMWLFYLPGQVLLVTSSGIERNGRRPGIL